jgi:hypothetical protein
MLGNRLGAALVVLLAATQCTDARPRRLTPQEAACWGEASEKIPNRMKCWPSGQGTFCENEAFHEQRDFVRECVKRPTALQQGACWAEATATIPNREKCVPPGMICENEALHEQLDFVRECMKRPAE